ncbi:MAG: very short patch repair endonuclease [Acidimicrobiia bacterium]
MRGNRRRDTKPEVRLRSRLHAGGYRFRVDYRIAAPQRTVRVDIAFPRHRLAVFVDGCFWHSCPDHGTAPRTNADYWNEKLARNSRRDQAIDAALLADGWEVLRVWEHDPPDDAAAHVTDVLSKLSGR